MSVAARLVAVAAALALSLAWASVAFAAPPPPATPRLVAEVRRVAGDLAHVPIPPEGPVPGLDARELRRRLATAQRELVAAGGSDRWLDPFFQRQDEAADDAARAVLARDAATALARIASEADGALAESGMRDAHAARATEARAALARILAEDEFQRFPRTALSPGDFEQWLLRLLDWWHRLQLPRLPGSIRWLGWLGDWLLAICFGAVVAVAVWMVLGRLRRERARALAASSVAGLGHGAARALGDLEEEVKASLAAGAFREALRALHLATLGRLRRMHRVPAALGLTHWDLLRALERTRAPGAALTRFATLNHAFDAAWYGRGAIDADHFARFRDTTMAFLEEIQSSAPPA
jgi:hypothetical protein